MPRIGERNGHEVEPLLPSPDETLWRYSASSPDRRIGRLYRLGERRDIADLIIFAVVGNGVLGPGLEDDFQRFVEAPLAFSFIDVEQVVLRLQYPAAHAKVESSITQDVQHGVFLRRANGVVEREQRHACPQTNAFSL